MTTITADVSAIIESYAAETRSNREIAKPVIDALKDCGFFKMMLPKKWGVAAKIRLKNFLPRKWPLPNPI